MKMRPISDAGIDGIYDVDGTAGANNDNMITFRGCPVVCTWMAVRYSARERWRNSHSTSSFAFIRDHYLLDVGECEANL